MATRTANPIRPTRPHPLKPLQPSMPDLAGTRLRLTGRPSCIVQQASATCPGDAGQQEDDQDGEPGKSREQDGTWHGLRRVVPQIAASELQRLRLSQDGVTTSQADASGCQSDQWNPSRMCGTPVSASYVVSRNSGPHPVTPITQLKERRFNALAGYIRQPGIVMAVQEYEWLARACKPVG